MLQVFYSPIEINDSEDLFYGLGIALQGHVVPYKEGGLYDKVVDNMKRYKDVDAFENQEEYEWYKIHMYSHNLLLEKPGKKAVFAEKKSFDKYGFPMIYSRIVNVSQLRLSYYQSAINKNWLAITYSDSRNMLKPLKVMKHNWRRVGSTENKDGEFVVSNYAYGIRICSKCGIKGRVANDVVYPESNLNCEEYGIKDILF